MNAVSKLVQVWVGSRKTSLFANERHSLPRSRLVVLAHRLQTPFKRLLLLADSRAKLHASLQNTGTHLHLHLHAVSTAPAGWPELPVVLKFTLLRATGCHIKYVSVAIKDAAAVCACSDHKCARVCGARRSATNINFSHTEPHKRVQRHQAGAGWNKQCVHSAGWSDWRIPRLQLGHVLVFPTCTQGR